METLAADLIPAVTQHRSAVCGSCLKPQNHLIRDYLYPATDIAIGIVFHVCYAVPDITQVERRIESKLKALNADFQLLNAKLVFFRAGIVVNALQIVDFAQQGDLFDAVARHVTTMSPAIKSELYLNVWIVDWPESQDVIGYAMVDTSNDGVMISRCVFDNDCRFNCELTHLIGHWLGCAHDITRYNVDALQIAQIHCTLKYRHGQIIRRSKNLPMICDFRDVAFLNEESKHDAEYTRLYSLRGHRCVRTRRQGQVDVKLDLTGIQQACLLIYVKTQHPKTHIWIQAAGEPFWYSTHLPLSRDFVGYIYTLPPPYESVFGKYTIRLGTDSDDNHYAYFDGLAIVTKTEQIVMLTPGVTRRMRHALDMIKNYFTH